MEHHQAFSKLFKDRRPCRYFGRNLGSLNVNFAFSVLTLPEQRETLLLRLISSCMMSHGRHTSLLEV